MTGSAAVSRKSASRPIGLTVGQRVLFRPAQWVVGVIIGGLRSKRERMTYQVKLDNGEIRWGAANQFRKAEL